MKALLLSTLFLVTTTAFAQDAFVIKKSYNPKNVLHYKANVVNCKLTKPTGKTTAVSAYWIMGEDDGETVPMNTKEKESFLPKVSYEKETELDFSIGALNDMQEVTDKSIEIRLVNCKPKAFLEIDGQEIMLTQIYADVSTGFGWSGFTMTTNYMNITGYAPNGTKTVKKIVK